MTASGSTQRVRQHRRALAVRLAVFAFLLGVPALGLFCLQYQSKETLTGNRIHSSTGEMPLAPIVGAEPAPDWNVAEAATGRSLVSSRVDNPLAGGQAMLTVNQDPFFEAFSAGITRGVLVLHSNSREVPAYGLAGIARPAAALSFSDRAILREIRRSLGSPTFATGTSKPSKTGVAIDGTSTRTEHSPEENPFSKSTAGNEASSAKGESADAKAATNPAAKQESGTGDAGATNAGKDAAPPAPDPKPQDAPAPAAGGSQDAWIPPAQTVGVVRPFAMLRLGADGSFKAMPATRIIDLTTFETAEFGIQPMNVLFFAKPAETGTSMAIADFNQDGIPDVCFDDSAAGFLHFLEGRPDGSYAETMKVDVGTGLRSLAAGDFDRDGRTDVAVSNTGIGVLTILYLGGPGAAPEFQTFWRDTYRDFVTSADASVPGVTDLLGATFVNFAEVLDIGRTDGTAMGKKFTLNSALNRIITLNSGYKLQLNAALFQSNLSVNMQNFRGQMINVATVRAGTDIYLVVGDINFNNSMSLAIATPKK